MHSLIFLIALSLAAAPPVAAPSVDANAAFERLKKMEGSWKTDAKDGPLQFVTLRLVASGTAVLETTTAADRTTITSATIYSFEGSKLIATHHGGGGTSRLELTGADPLAIKFDGTGKDARVAALSLVVKQSKLRQEFTTRESGRDVKKSLDLLSEYVDTLK
ncbi:MAG: hypothetical protein Q8N23_10370 [Archangium sp.]|nr:hypothetical protein [Archangium sp.]MDP3153065.1 hypothetical protein [Archangium sp.]MDP3572548.1 hypothetical protein [Archangium sp.]